MPRVFSEHSTVNLCREDGVSIAVEGNDMAVMQQPIDEGGHDVISEDCAPILKAILDVTPSMRLSARVSRR
jgi:hypothetical protein